LGPTKDDVTKKTLAHYFNDELIFNDEVYLHVKKADRRLLQPTNYRNEPSAGLRSV